MKRDKITLAHGSGGKLSQRLIEEVIYPAFGSNGGHELLDAASFTAWGKMAFTTDSFVISPLFFSGGDIGKLAACGTINDLAVSGAEPLFLSVGLIIEEGFEISKLQKILQSLANTAETAGAAVVTGDTKVVERGNADKLYINTAGIGLISPGTQLGPANIEVGDVIIVSGTMGDHGMAVLSCREGLSFETVLTSDCAALNGLVEAVSRTGSIVCMRDPTRGGLATTLCELAEQSGTVMEIIEDQVPVKPAVTLGCAMLGMDPLYLANEGKVIIIAKNQSKEKVLTAVKGHPLGSDAQIIGKVTGRDQGGAVLLETTVGAKRLLRRLEGEHLPRIC
ncbi:hydrogenase expression/formation protein HypE [Metallumcola ferriviriculae]|uniref:Hydrogenase expression/formation protein HypE n=1 Tax=Metallumcola ferriviriculae TaxID=3039180 RepID=A0AAU0URD8_9FIRM|nr:hydrogenase expression/formation protein HypE [Desulfitibacteraceae bacterium MK1]